MITERHAVTQTNDGDRVETFLKEVIHLDDSPPLAMVRKRLPDAKGPARAALLLTHGFGQNRYAWHLSRRSFVNHLAADGFDVFNLDLRGHGRSRVLDARGCAVIDEYIHHDIPRALDAALALSGGARAFIVGHSLGGLVAYAAAAALRDRLRGVVTVGSPYVFGRGNRVLLEVARIGAALTGLGSGVAFPMRLVQRLFHAQRKLWNARSLPIPIRAWHPGSIEEDLLEEYIRIAFDRATFGEMAHIAASGTRGRFASADGTLDYARTWEETDVPTLIVAGTRDLLAPEDSVRPAYERSRAKDKTFHAFPLGHADLLIGRDAPRMTWPTVSSWIARRCDATTRPRSRAA